MTGAQSFAQALIMARRVRGLTRAAAAQALGVSANTLGYIETGQRDCHRHTAATLVKFYNLPAETLLLP